MLLITLLSLIGVLVYTIIKICSFRSMNIKFIFCGAFILMFLLEYGFQYFNQSPIQLSTVIGLNFWTLFIYAAIVESISVWMLHLVNTKTIIATCIFLGICMLIGAGIHMNSAWNIQKSYHSISVKISKSKRAPSMKRGETPVAIPPATVFYKINNDFGSNVPHYNALEPAQYGLSITQGDSTEIEAQYYKGKPVYIVPLEFKSLFRYFQFRVIPGYFRISATNPSAHATFVHTPIKYGDNMPFGHNVERNIYRAKPQYRSLSGQAQLEIGPSGHPYYVETEFRPSLTNTRPRFNHLKIAVEDAETGHVKFYNQYNTPKFVDENLTSKVADSINNYYGHFVHGYLNYKLWGKNGVKNPTENGPEDGVTTIFNHNKTISYVTDYTSVTGSTTTIGCSAINARTGKLTYYRTRGMMDSNQAEHNASNTYAYKHWSPDMPVLYDIDGHATWVMSILDQSNKQRAFYYVNNNAGVTAHDSSAKETLDDFRSQLSSKGGTNSNSKAMKAAIKKGTISRFAIVGSKGVFTLKGSKKVYTVNLSDDLKASLLKIGDNVKFMEDANGAHNTAKDVTAAGLD